MPPHPLTNFEIQKHYQNEPKINSDCNIVIIEESESIRTHWIALYVSGNNVKYFDSFGVAHIPKNLKKS